MIGHDLRYALRSLGKNRAFTAIAVITLALGVGANTAIFSVVHGILFKSLPYPDPNRLMVVWETDVHNNSMREPASAPDLADFQAQNRSFDKLAGWTVWNFNLTDASRPPERIDVAGVTPNLFPLLGAMPQIGRTFGDDTDRTGADGVALLSDQLWHTRYGRDPRILQSRIVLDGKSYEIVGVMPREFDFPREPDVWVPLHAIVGGFRDIRGVHNVGLLGRLRPEVTVEQAQAEMTLIAQRLAQQYPEDNRGRGVFVEPMHEAVVGRFRRALLVLLAAVAVVLLIACTNIASLLLARTSARAREMAIRTSLGASQWRVIRQLLTESMALSVMGGIAGLALAFWGVDLLLAVSPENLPRAHSIRIDGPVLIFTLTVSLFSGLIFGLAPAIHVSRVSLSESLKAGGSRVAARIRGGGRTLLVVTELALAVVLVIGAGLLIRSFWRLLNVDPGFRADNVLVMRVKLPEATYPVPPRNQFPKWPEVERFQDEVLERVRPLPGVRSAALAINHPLQRGWTSQVRIVGRPVPDGPVDESRIRAVSPDYFKTVGVPLLIGRDVAPSDRSDAPLVVLVNQSFVRKYFPNENPIGKQLTFWGKPRDIVGVVGDVRFMGLDSPSEPAVYPPFQQLAMSEISLLVHTANNPMSVLPAVRDAIWSIDRDLAIYDINTLEGLMHESLGTPRFQMLLLTIFGLVALVLATVGVYGVISYRVDQRTQEIGVRLALGAQNEQILKLVVGEGSLLALAGISVGLAAGALATRYMSALLFGVSSHDLLTYLSVSSLLAVIAIVASYLPARRAMRVEPIAALRYE